MKLFALVLAEVIDLVVNSRIILEHPGSRNGHPRRARIKGRSLYIDPVGIRMGYISVFLVAS